MKEYLKAQSKTNEIIVGNSVTPDELDRFSKSDFRWADNRKKSFQHRSVKKGEIYQFEFGKNFIPEMSYEHRGLVICIPSIYSQQHPPISAFVSREYTCSLSGSILYIPDHTDP